MGDVSHTLATALLLGVAVVGAGAAGCGATAGTMRPDDVRPEILDEVLVWALAELPEPVTIDLPSLFAAALGEA